MAARTLALAWPAHAAGAKITRISTACPNLFLHLHPSFVLYRMRPRNTVRAKMHWHKMMCRFGSSRERLRKGLLVLLTYPVFGIIAAMNLLGGDLQWSTQLFFYAGLIYPLIYFACVEGTVISRRKKNRIAALVVSGVPLQYLGLVAAVATLSLLVEGSPP